MEDILAKLSSITLSTKCCTVAYSNSNWIFMLQLKDFQVKYIHFDL